MEKLVSGLIFVLSFPCLPKSGLLQWGVYLRYFFGFFCRCFFSLRLKCNSDWFLFLDFISNVLITRSHFHIAIFLLFFFYSRLFTTAIRFTTHIVENTNASLRLYQNLVSATGYRIYKKNCKRNRSITTSKEAGLFAVFLWFFFSILYCFYC